MGSRAGFSLVELLIVVAIVGILTTIAVPLLLGARRSALDEKARQSVRVVMSAQQAYYMKYSEFGGFGELTLDAPPFLDSRFTDLGADLGNGLLVTIEVAPDGQAFEVTASNPAGNYDYFGDNSFVIQQL
jgi:prepilin-type N-terminal cleavage/methylation domain-containing protein